MGKEMIVIHILTTIGASICARTGGRQVMAHILTDIQFSTRLASDSDSERVVTLRNAMQVDTLHETDLHNITIVKKGLIHETGV